jgi:hypothetical protein
MTKEEKEAYFAKVDALEAKFATEREEINSFIKENIINKLADVKNIAELQVHQMSQRQRMSDKISTLKNRMRKHGERLASERKARYFYYKTEYNLRMNDSEISKHIDADTEAKTSFRTVLENQIDYYRRTIEGLDKIGFAVKYVIEQNRFLNGGY